MARKHVSGRTDRFEESVIREMTRISDKYRCVNLAQGFPDFDTPAPVVEAAVTALRDGFNQYSITWGARSLRQAIADSFARFYGMEFNPEEEITVCCGATEAMISTILGTRNPGDKIIVFEPYYENYLPDSILGDAELIFVQLEYRDSTWQINWPLLEAAFARGASAIIINTPNNPTGKVFTEDELSRIAALCRQHDVLCITDEIYEHITFDGTRHIPMVTIPGMRERTVTINALSKTFSVTGWRVGWAIAPREITNAIRKVHDFVTVGAPHPFQEAGAKALALPDDYFAGLGAFYQDRRDYMSKILDEAGFRPTSPVGAYYMIAFIDAFGMDNDVTFARWLAREVGVSVVPGSSFYRNPEDGRNWVRFCFSKTFETLDAARERLMRIRSLL